MREGLLQLVDAARSDEDYENIGAGPIEHFIKDDESRLAWIERTAGDSEGFQRALAHVWVWRLPDEAFRRVERAAGVALADPQADERARRLGEC